MSETKSEKKGRPISQDEADLYRCSDCDKLWRMEHLKPMHHAWSRHEDGDAFHPFECPECGGTAPLAEGESVLFSPTDDNLKKHAYHTGIFIHFGEGMDKPMLSCEECSQKETYMVEESEISKPEEGE